MTLPNSGPSYQARLSWRQRSAAEWQRLPQSCLRYTRRYGTISASRRRHSCQSSRLVRLAPTCLDARRATPIQGKKRDATAFTSGESIAFCASADKIRLLKWMSCSLQCANVMSMFALLWCDMKQCSIAAAM